jgi:predicted nucleotide-binding protein (sugar kinase/HSP70/actin superfamily)
MIASFPHMRNLYIPVSAFIKSLGAEVVVPPRPSPSSIKLGAKYSPEFICFPFKVNLGDLIYAVKKGADTLISFSGFWSCRFGYYGRLHHQILRDMGYKFESIIIGKDNWSKVYHKVRLLNDNNTAKTMSKIWYSMRLFWTKSKLIEIAEDLAREVRPYERNKNATTKVLNRALELIDKTNDMNRLRALRKKIYSMFGEIDVDKERKPLKIYIVGETYCVIEPIANFDIERRLGEMGVWCEPFYTIHKWLFQPLHIGVRRGRGEAEAKKKAIKYIPHSLGGKDQQSIGFTITASQRGFDGVIHLQPFACMPESIAHTILLKVSREYNIPVLSLSIDEHTGEAGVITRIEAFLDLLYLRRKRHKYF